MSNYVKKEKEELPSLTPADIAWLIHTLQHSKIDLGVYPFVNMNQGYSTITKLIKLKEAIDKDV